MHYWYIHLPDKTVITTKREFQMTNLRSKLDTFLLTNCNALQGATLKRLQSYLQGLSDNSSAIKL